MVTYAVPRTAGNRLELLRELGERCDQSATRFRIVHHNADQSRDSARESLFSSYKTALMRKSIRITEQVFPRFIEHSMNIPGRRGRRERHLLEFLYA